MLIQFILVKERNIMYHYKMQILQKHTQHPQKVNVCAGILGNAIIYPLSVS